MLREIYVSAFYRISLISLENNFNFQSFSVCDQAKSFFDQTFPGSGSSRQWMRTNQRASSCHLIAKSTFDGFLSGREIWRWIWWVVCFLTRIISIRAAKEGRYGLISTMQCIVWPSRPEWTNMIALSVRFLLVKSCPWKTTTCFVTFCFSLTISIFLICLHNLTKLGLVYVTTVKTSTNHTILKSWLFFGCF